MSEKLETGFATSAAPRSVGSTPATKPKAPLLAEPDAPTRCRKHQARGEPPEPEMTRPGGLSQEHWSG